MPGALGGSEAASTTSRAAISPGVTADPDGTTQRAATDATSPTSGSGTATLTAAATAQLAELQAAVDDLSAGIREQVDAGQLVSTAGSDLQGKVDKILRYATEGDWATARYYADQVRIKLGKYLDSGTITATGYQALIPKVDAVDTVLS